MKASEELKDEAIEMYMSGGYSLEEVGVKFNVSTSTVFKWVKKYKLNNPKLAKHRAEVYKTAAKVADSKTNRVRRDFTGMSKDQIRLLRNQSANDYYHKHVKKKGRRSLSDLDIALVEHLTFVKQHLTEHIRRLDFEITSIMNRGM